MLPLLSRSRKSAATVNPQKKRDVNPAEQSYLIFQLKVTHYIDNPGA
jgi:hypothetical protein